jgi:hypothetical protein
MTMDIVRGAIGRRYDQMQREDWTLVVAPSLRPADHHHPTTRYNSMTDKTPKTISYSATKLRGIGKAMRLGMKEFDKLTKPAPLTASERTERRASQQRARRAEKAISEVLL